MRDLQRADMVVVAGEQGVAGPGEVGDIGQHGDDHTVGELSEEGSIRIEPKTISVSDPWATPCA